MAAAVSFDAPLFGILMTTARLIGADGFNWAQPAADVLSLADVIRMLRHKIGKNDFFAQEAVNENE